MNTTPGSQTSEFKLSAAAVGAITVAYVALMALVSSHALAVPSWLVAVVTAVYPVVTGGVAVSYTRGRTDLKVAITNATTQQALASIEAQAPLLNDLVLNSNVAAHQGVAVETPPPVVNPAPVSSSPTEGAAPPQ